MTKTLSSITLLLLASGWLSLLPAETKAGAGYYRCDYCKKRFDSRSEESQRCFRNEKADPTASSRERYGPHKFLPFQGAK